MSDSFSEPTDSIPLDIKFPKTLSQHEIRGLWKTQQSVSGAQTPHISLQDTVQTNPLLINELSTKHEYVTFYIQGGGGGGSQGANYYPYCTASSMTTSSAKTMMSGDEGGILGGGGGGGGHGHIKRLTFLLSKINRVSWKTGKGGAPNQNGESTYVLIEFNHPDHHKTMFVAHGGQCVSHDPMSLSGGNGGNGEFGGGGGASSVTPGLGGIGIHGNGENGSETRGGNGALNHFGGKGSNGGGSGGGPGGGIGGYQSVGGDGHRIGSGGGGGAGGTCDHQQGWEGGNGSNGGLYFVIEKK